MKTPSPLQPHPIAAIFEMMDDGSYQSLRDNIKANGLLFPITLHEGQILDGRNRYKACAELGIDPAITTYNGSSPTDFVMGANLHRRHLSKSARALAAVKAFPFDQEEARKRQATLNNRALTLPEEGASETGTAMEIASRKAGVNPSYAYAALRVQREDPEAFAQIESGEITVKAAYRNLAKKTDEDAGGRKPQEKRAAQIRELAANGHTAKQIAAEIGLGAKRVRRIANIHGISLTDRIIGKAHRIHAKRVIEQTVNGLVGYAHGLETIGKEWDDVTPEDAAAWIEDLGRSLRIINRLMKSLREFST